MAALHLARQRGEERGARTPREDRQRRREVCQAPRSRFTISFTYYSRRKSERDKQGKGNNAMAQCPTPQSVQRRMKRGTNTNRQGEGADELSYVESPFLISKTKKSSKCKWDAPSLGPCSAAWLAACGPSRRRRTRRLELLQKPFLFEKAAAAAAAAAAPAAVGGWRRNGYGWRLCWVGRGGWDVGKMGLPTPLGAAALHTDSTQSGLQVEAKEQKMNRWRREVRSRRVATHETRNPHDGREQEQKQGRREGEEMRDVRGMKKEGRRGKGSRERSLPLRASPLSLYSTCKRSMKRPPARGQTSAEAEYTKPFPRNADKNGSLVY